MTSWSKYQYNWQRMSFMTVFNAKGNLQGWISVVYPKGRASRKKTFAVYLVQSSQYCSFRGFKLQSFTRCWLIIATTATRAWKHPAIVSWNVLLLLDNARPYSERITQEKILGYGWSVLPHPTHLLDLPASNFLLFCSLQNPLNEKKTSQENLGKTFVENFLSLKPADFYLRGISKLPER